MVVDSHGIPPLPPSPLSRPAETIDPVRVRLSWVTPAYTAIACALPALPAILMMGGAGLAWIGEAVSAGVGAVLGLGLAAADRLAPNRSRVFRWTAGLVVAVLLTHGVGLTWVAVSSGGLQTFGAQMAFLAYALPALALVLLGVGWGLLAATLGGIWWKLPAAGAAAFAISAALRLVARWALWPAGQPAPAGVQYAMPGLLFSVLTGALLGLAVAAGLDRGRRGMELGES